MSDILSSVGTELYVSAGAPSTYDVTGFTAKTYALAGEVSDIPEYGTEAALATHTPIATGIVAKRRGSINFGSLTIPFALSESDMGEDILKTIAESPAGSDATVSVKVLFPNGAIDFYTAQVMSFRTNIANADSILMGSVMLEIDGKIIKVPPV